MGHGKRRGIMPSIQELVTVFFIFAVVLAGVLALVAVKTCKIKRGEGKK